ncbi:hypothetical protein [Lysobacter sp. CFH 32150]|uniref:hypothetical protein n=1 Tax=Lysobacter sp. CFH 32150 TaxID=2927128 RepID=UPI001FA76850|nr:hypothetical protein [Lysobacter sp. CFH 32150]MCI4567973.1 hypothetical protein [Lysobacter sp. CFH 32150]
MNIWTQLLSLNGHPLDGGWSDPSTQTVGAGRVQSVPQLEDRDQETEAARRAIPLWRPAPWIAIR